MRIVIEDGDELTIESRRAGLATQAAAAEATDGGGAPTALIRQFAEGPERAAAEAAAPEAEHVEPPGGEPPLNPLRAGAAVARGEAVDEREAGPAPARPEKDET